MKKCPNCEMIVDADNECPFCYTTITYEPIVNADSEKYVYNEYFIWYLIKQSWFSLLCLIFVVFKILCVQMRSIPLCIFSVLLAVLSLVYSIYQRKITKYLQWKYSKEYSKFKSSEAKIMLGILAVLFSFAIPYV